MPNNIASTVQRRCERLPIGNLAAYFIFNLWRTTWKECEEIAQIMDNMGYRDVNCEKVTARLVGIVIGCELRRRGSNWAV